MTPKSWFDRVIGKQIDTDNFPRSNPFQCWDSFDAFCRLIGFDGSRKCAATQYVGDLWLLRDKAGYDYSRAFDYVTDPANFRDGDWIFWPQHVAMYYQGQQLGQNQPYAYHTMKELNRSGILGAMRWRGWTNINIAYGASDLEINGHTYHLYRQNPKEKVAVIGAGLNNVAKITDLDADVLIYAKVTGANFFQNDPDNPAGRPFGETYGDVSAPLSGMYQSLPDQDSTLFFDLDDGGKFGDCSQVEVNRAHNVFSPALVYPNEKGHFEYARMVGVDHANRTSRFSFVIQMDDGYVLGIAAEDLTPKQIVADFEGVKRIAFLDGGDSAMFGRWNGQEFEYVRKTSRAVPSAVIIYREITTQPETMPQDIEPQATPNEKEKDEEIIMPEEKPAETPETTSQTTDVVPYEPKEVVPYEPAPVPVTVREQIARLIDVKSIMTLILICTLCYMAINGRELDERFMTIIVSVVTFYFSYQSKKG